MTQEQILYTSTVFGYPPIGGPEIYVANTIRALSIGNNLHLLSGSSNSFASQNGFDYEAFKQSLGIRSFHEYRSTRFNSRILNKIFRGLALFGFSNHVREFAKITCEHAVKNNCNIVWVGYGNISFQYIRQLRKINPSLLIVCDTDSVWSDFVLRSGTYANPIRKSPIWLTGVLHKKQESSFLKYANAVTAVSRVDLKRYQSIMQTFHGVFEKSNVINIDEYIKYENTEVNQYSICLMGSFGKKNSSMDSSTRWFLKDIFPLISNIEPRASVQIVGKNASNWSSYSSSTVHVHSDVDSTLPYIARSHVVIVPLLFESGTRFKILEAGALKKPLVSTTLGAEGLPVFNEEHILVGDTSQSFANAVLRAFDQSVGGKISSNLNSLVKREFTVLNAAEQCDLVIKTLTREQLTRKDQNASRTRTTR
jgi:glycosyltransferase involved in cell wall biosynthesis